MAPKAPTIEDSRNNAPPTSPHLGCRRSIETVFRVRLGPVPTSCVVRGFATRRAVPTERSPSGAASASRPAAASSSRKGPDSWASRTRDPLLHDPAAVEHSHLVGAHGRGEPMGDEQSGTAGKQPLRRARHASLGHRVHASRCLVQHDDLPAVGLVGPLERLSKCRVGSGR